MAYMKRNSKKVNGIFSILIAVAVLSSLCGCGNGRDVNQFVSEPEAAAVQTADTQQAEVQYVAQDVPEEMQSGGDLDVVMPSADDDEWYKKGNIYTDDNGRRLEVYFNDEGMLEFVIDGLSLYYTMADKFQQENNWRIYTCDDGTIIVYYPGTPAHLEISDGEYAGLYEAGGDKMK